MWHPNSEYLKFSIADAVKNQIWKKKLASDFENFDDRISEPLCMFDFFVLVLSLASIREDHVCIFF
jgi:hypothetical protein